MRLAAALLLAALLGAPAFARDSSSNAAAVRGVAWPPELRVHRQPTFDPIEAKLSAEQLAEAHARAERWVAAHPAKR